MFIQFSDKNKCLWSGFLNSRPAIGEKICFDSVYYEVKDITHQIGAEDSGDHIIYVFLQEIE